MNEEMKGGRAGRLNEGMDRGWMDRQILALALSPSGHGRLEILVQILLQTPLTPAATRGSADSPWGTVVTLDPALAPRGAADTQDKPLCPHAEGNHLPRPRLAL